MILDLVAVESISIGTNACEDSSVCICSVGLPTDGVGGCGVEQTSSGWSFGGTSGNANQVEQSFQSGSPENLLFFQAISCERNQEGRTLNGSKKA